MRRRVLAAVVAVVLAATGGLLLFRYVHSADQRAMAGMRSVDVLVAVKTIPKGTPVDQLVPLVALKTLPATAVVDGSINGLDQVRGEVATVDIEPGEQLLVGRFADPASLLDANEVKSPPGLHQVSIQLEPQRIVGSELKAGATVAAFLSFKEPDSTHLTLHKVLVTRVAPTVPTGSEGDAAASAAAPMMITMAVTGPQAEKLVFAAEHGTVWLSAEPEDAPEGGTKVLTKENLFK